MPNRRSGEEFLPWILPFVSKKYRFCVCRFFQDLMPGTEGSCGLCSHTKCSPAHPQTRNLWLSATCVWGLFFLDFEFVLLVNELFCKCRAHLERNFFFSAVVLSHSCTDRLVASVQLDEVQPDKRLGAEWVRNIRRPPLNVCDSFYNHIFTENKQHNVTRTIKCGRILVQAGRQLKSESPIAGKSPFNHCFPLTIIILNQKKGTKPVSSPPLPLESFIPCAVLPLTERKKKQTMFLPPFRHDEPEKQNNKILAWNKFRALWPHDDTKCPHLSVWRTQVAARRRQVGKCFRQRNNKSIITELSSKILID